MAPLCRHALDLNFDGLFIESHCNPEQALSDSAQQVTPAELAAILDTIGTTVAVAGSSVWRNGSRNYAEKLTGSTTS